MKKATKHKITEEKILLSDIGKNIKFWREINGFTREEMIQEMNFSRSYLSRLEHGNVGISFEKICEISKFLNIFPHTLLKNAPTKKNYEILKDIWKSEPIISISDFEILFSMYPVNLRVDKLFFLKLLTHTTRKYFKEV
jgi:transcriptional regulator with XRE-family HTH domain